MSALLFPLERRIFADFKLEPAGFKHTHTQYIFETSETSEQWGIKEVVEL